MRIIADKYIDDGNTERMVQGIEVGKQAGITEGIQIGEARGRAEGKAELIKMLLNNGNSMESVAKMTSLSISEINNMLNTQ